MCFHLSHLVDNCSIPLFEGLGSFLAVCCISYSKSNNIMWTGAMTGSSSPYLVVVLNCGFSSFSLKFNNIASLFVCSFVAFVIVTMITTSGCDSFCCVVVDIVE